ncbi:MAG: hypothetical protein V2J07_06870, partial [Anaerolineae bacterium]|nr:hypothetical protein [Anaerolineae bacterium]
MMARKNNPTPHAFLLVLISGIFVFYSLAGCQSDHSGLAVTPTLPLSSTPIRSASQTLVPSATPTPMLSSTVSATPQPTATDTAEGICAVFLPVYSVVERDVHIQQLINDEACT